MSFIIGFVDLQVIYNSFIIIKLYLPVDIKLLYIELGLREQSKLVYKKRISLIIDQDFGIFTSFT